MPRALFLLLALFVFGCPPSLNGGDDDDDDAADDDDSAAGDDDDATVDDDDDDDDTEPSDDDDVIDPPPPPLDDDDSTPWPDDDDDIVDSCAEPGVGGVWFDASAGDADGIWYEGEVAWDGSDVTVTPAFGPALAIPVTSSNVDLASVFLYIGGPGRVMVAATSWGWESANGVLAVQDDYSGAVAVLGVNSPSVPALSTLGFDLTVTPDFTSCTTPQFDVDGCGMGAAVPLGVEVATDWSAEYTQTWPGAWQWMGNGIFTQYQGWQVFETVCEDFESPGYSWTYSLSLDIDG